MNMNTAGIEVPNYVTQDGDSVMGIALRQCGNEAEWSSTRGDRAEHIARIRALLADRGSAADTKS